MGVRHVDSVSVLASSALGRGQGGGVGVPFTGGPRPFLSLSQPHAVFRQLGQNQHGLNSCPNCQPRKGHVTLVWTKYMASNR